jgi:ankyrin repeat protein
LIEAAKSQDWDKLRTLLEQGEQATVTSADGATALHWASYWDNIETAELLINTGADPDAMNDLGATALWNASLNGSEEMVGMLLRKGADPLSLIALLQTQLRQLLSIATGDKVKLPPETIKKLRTLLKQKSFTELLLLLKKLHEKEFAVKRGIINGEEALKSLAFEL